MPFVLIISRSEKLLGGPWPLATTHATEAGGLLNPSVGCEKTGAWRWMATNFPTTRKI